VRLAVHRLRGLGAGDSRGARARRGASWASASSQCSARRPCGTSCNGGCSLLRTYCEPPTPHCPTSRAVGYASEAAFNRAFKRPVGQPPAAWRALPRHVKA